MVSLKDHFSVSLLYITDYPVSQVAPEPLLFKQIPTISCIMLQEDYCPALNIFCLRNGRDSRENLETVVMLSFIVKSLKSWPLTAVMVLSIYVAAYHKQKSSRSRTCQLTGVKYVYDINFTLFFHEPEPG